MPTSDRRRLLRRRPRLPETGSLESPVEGLLATPPSRLPYQADVLVRSFVLQRTTGNVIVYN